MSESIMLCRFSLKQNSNKFYEIILPNEHGNVYCRYGRVGQNGQKVQYPGGRRQFDSLVREKTSNKKGYKQVDLDIISDADGNIISHSDGGVNPAEIALSQINYADKKSEDLIRYLSKENIHNITSATNITYDDKTGSFKTPLGIITLKSIQRSFDILNSISEIINQYPSSSFPTNVEEELDALNAEYFVLVPTKIKDTTNKSLLLYSIKNVEHQFEICQMLYETVSTKEDIIKQSIKKDSDTPKAFDVSISHLADLSEFSRINKYFERSKNSIHGGKLSNSKISNIYNINMKAQQEPFEITSKKIGNIEELFHGTRVANLLSILSKGLLKPNNSPGAKAGSLFGKGVYFANQSTKSAQYCDGMRYAGGVQKQKIYMFLADVSLGKSYTPKYLEQHLPAGYDSFYAKAGVSGVMNDEIIVFNTSQFKLTYILEIEI